MTIREVPLESTGKEESPVSEEYDFHYRKRMPHLKQEIATLLRKIDATAENDKKG